MSAYWLGVITLPALSLALFALLVASVRTDDALRRRGFFVEVRRSRLAERVGDYTLTHDIWWERSFGPVFVGGWYRERPDRPKISRWVGLGSGGGPCVMAGRVRDLQPAQDAPGCDLTGSEGETGSESIRGSERNSAGRNEGDA